MIASSNGGVFRQIPVGLESLGVFDAAGFAPSEAELEQLLSQLPELKEIHLSGKNLSKIPEAVTSRLQYVTIDELGVPVDRLDGLRWQMIDQLSLINSKVSDAVLRSWTFPDLYSVDLSGADVTFSAVETLCKGASELQSIRINRDADDGVEDDFIAYGKTLSLRGRPFSQKELAAVRRLGFESIDLRGCQIEPKTLGDIRDDLSPMIFYLDPE